MNKKTIKILTILSSLVYAFVFVPSFVNAQQDVTPPELLSFDFNPKVINTDLGDQIITGTAVGTDDLSGFLELRVVFAIPGVQAVFLEMRPTGQVTIPQFSAPGTYRIVTFVYRDRIGNSVSLSREEVAARGFPTEFFNGNTPSGSNIIVGPLNGVTLTINQVTQAGHTSVASSSSGNQPPSGFKLGAPPLYYDISTTAIYNGPVEVCINYDETQFRNENNLKLAHFENGAWINTTTSLDTIGNIICGSVSSLSEFGLFEDLSVDHIIDEVRSFNLNPDIEQGLLDKLNAAKSAIERNQNKTARNILKAFINLVNAQENKKITSDQANILRADAQALINSLGGNLLSTIFKWVLFGWLDKFINAMLGSKL